MFPQTFFQRLAEAAEHSYAEQKQTVKVADKVTTAKKVADKVTNVAGQTETTGKSGNTVNPSRFKIF